MSKMDEFQSFDPVGYSWLWPVDWQTDNWQLTKTMKNSCCRATLVACLLLLIIFSSLVRCAMHEAKKNDCRTNVQIGIVQKLLVGYDKTLMPANESVKAKMELTVQDITSVSETTSSFEADIWYSQIWLDPRMRFEDISCHNSTSLDESVVPKLWSVLKWFCLRFSHYHRLINLMTKS